MAENQSTYKPETWVADYGDYLFRFALLRLRDHAAAEDVVQDTFLAGVKGLHKFDGRVDIKFWLRGICRNKIVDHIRKASRMKPMEDIGEYELPESSESKMKWFGIPTSRPEPWEFDLHQAFDKKEFWAIFEECLSGLDGPIQKAFVLKELEGMSTEEVCKVLEIKPNYVWVMVYRARAKLKDCLEAKWGKTK